MIGTMGMLSLSLISCGIMGADIQDVPSSSLILHNKPLFPLPTK